MKNLKAWLIGIGIAAGLTAGLAISQTYTGFNPITGLNGQVGLPVAVGSPPTVTGCSQTGVVGGGGTFQVTAGATSCTLTVTLNAASTSAYTAAAPNGLFCVYTDETHPSDTISQASHTTTTSVSSAATVSVGDKILVECNGF
jgi:hypothetical protein